MTKPENKPNLLLVMIDCMRADFFYKERGPEHTPNLDFLLRQGPSFTSFYSVTATTTPCTATILTGMYPVTHGVRAQSGYRMRPGVTT
jgi:arylsulfatase A-like enzyme